MKTSATYNIQIWVGLKPGYMGTYRSIEEVRKIVRDYIDNVKDCVTITHTEFQYVDGWEPGVIVGWIRYPRFPISDEELTDRALLLGELLRKGLDQIRVSIVTPSTTYLLEDDE